MKLAETKDTKFGSDATSKRIEEKRKLAQAQRVTAAQEEEAAVLRLKTQQAEDAKRAVEAEVARLQAALAEAQSGRRGRVNFQRSRPGPSASAHTTPRSRPPMWVDPKPPPQGAAASPPRRVRAQERPNPVGERARGFTFVDPRPPPARDLSGFAVPFGGTFHGPMS